MARRLITTPERPEYRPTRPSPVRPLTGPPRMESELATVRAHWDRSYAMGEQTRVRIEELITRYCRWLDASEVTSFCDATPAQARAFVLAATQAGTVPIIATSQARRTALRMLYRTLRYLGRPVGDPTLDLVLPPKGSHPARPLTDDEVALCRITVHMSRSRTAALRPVMWALGEASAITSEMSRVRISDLDHPTRPTSIRLPGTCRHDARTAALTDWGAAIISGHTTRLLAAGATPDTLLAYTGKADAGGATAQASACNAIREVLTRTSLIAEDDVRPASLRHWAARAAFDTGATIEQVAHMLGTRSLDTAAGNIHHHWRHDGETQQVTR